MKTLLRFAALLLASVPLGLPRVWAQTPTLEFISGYGPTANGISVADQTVTFRNNTNNPTGTNFVAYTPPTSVVFRLDNQVYRSVASVPTTNTGASFGGGNNSSGPNATSLPIYQELGDIGGSTAGNFTSASGVSGGISTTTNYGVEVLLSTRALSRTASTSGEYEYADFTITFNQAVVNPVLHFSGLGGASTTSEGTIGYTTNLRLITTGVTLSKLSGSNELEVSSTTIGNNGVNGTGVFNGTTGSGAASGSVLVTTPATGITSLKFRLSLQGDGQVSTWYPNPSTTHGGDGWLISVSTRSAISPITGVVYEDVNYGGGAGRPRSASGTAVRSGARVELYDANGAYVGFTTTNASGQYSFAPSTLGDYTVRVVSGTVTSSRPGAVGTLVPVQTYNGTTTRVGGEAPSRVDAGANITNATLASLTNNTTNTIAQSQADVTVAVGSSAVGADFGFNFNTIVNTNDAGQGSLRQFLTNANTLGNAGLAQVGQTAGVEASIFMIPDGNAHAGLLAAANGGPASLLNANGVAVITPVTALPALNNANGANTSIDGTTQTTNINNSNTGTLGAGGNVGTAGTALGTVNQPEVQIVGSTGIAIGLEVGAAATGTNIEGIAIYGFGNNANNDNNANIKVAANNTTVTGNVIGGSATNFSTAQTSNSSNVRITAGTGVQITNNLIGYANGVGVRVSGGSTITISGNEIIGNGRSNNLDGVNIAGASVTLTNNYIGGHAGNGVELASGGNNAVISGNTITNNGLGTAASSGIRLAATGATISTNVINANYGAGIRGLNGSTNNTFSRNSIYDNGNVNNTANDGPSGQIGIDLLSSDETSNPNQNNGVTPYVTLNDNGDGDTGANGLTNMPVITSALVRNGNLIISGFARSGATLEFFLAKQNTNSPNPNFGQGQTFLFSVAEGGGSDTNTNTGSYGLSGATVNGFNQGTETNQNAFSFTAALSALTAAQRTALSTGTALLTATATQVTLVGNNQGTSEFSGNVTVQVAPVPNAVTNVTIPNTNGATALNPGLSATAYGVVAGTSTPNSIQYYTITQLPGFQQGTLTYNGTVLTDANIAATQILPSLLGTLTYTPQYGSTTTPVTFQYSATDANGITSAANNNGGTVTSGPATYTIPLSQVADVTTTLSGQTQVIPGSTNSFTVTFSNTGPNTASAVTRTVTLPAGSTNITATGSQSISGTTITYSTLGTLASGSSNSFNFSFTPPATAGDYALTSTVGTSSGQGANSGPDQATLTLNVAGAPFDCNSAFFRVRQASVGSNSVLERLDRTISGGTVSYSGTALYTAPAVLNALAFNYADGYLYAFLVSGTAGNTLYRLSSTGAQNLGPQANLPVSGFNAATSDLNGVIYLANNSTSTIYKMTPATGFTVTTQATNASVNYGDMVYNPVDNNLYAVRYYSTSGANGISRINPTSGAVTVLGTPAASGEDVGSMFCDAAGSVYVASNQGTLALVNTSTGAYTSVGNAGSASQSDGASCVFPTQDIDVVLSAGTPVRVSATAFDVTYTVRVRNTGVTTDPNVQVNNFLNNGTNTAGAAFPGASSVTVQTAPAVTAGTALAVNSGFNGTTNTGLLAGTTTLPSGANSTITYTVRVTYPTVASIPTAAQNNSVYASTVTTGPNSGYTLVNGVAIAPSTVLAGDESTNGATLPSTPNGDTPTPTPVTFSNPLAQDITNVAVSSNSGAVVLNPNLSATPGLNGTGSAISSFTVTGPVSNGTLRYNGTTVSGAVSVPVANIGLLTYQPAAGFTGNASFTFSAIDAAGGISNTATYTIPVQNVADVTTAITGPTQLNTGQPTGTYTVTYANVGAASASGVTRTVTLPSGATLTPAQTTAITSQGGSVSGSTIDFGTVTTLTAGASSSFTFSFTAPATAGTTTVTANTSTTSNEGGNTAPNSSTINTTVNTVADVVASISPIAATVSAGATGAGFNVVFSNTGTLAAAGVTRTVQLPANLTGVSVTGSGSYDPATGLVTYTPSPTTLGSGASLSSTITFTAPASGPVAATASVNTTSNEANQTTNNVAAASLAITPAFDLATTISGPTTAAQGNEVVLNVTTTNNGPSAAPNVAQTVQLIGGLTDVYVSGGGSYNSANGLVTFPTVGSLPLYQSLANTISFKAPAPGTTLAPAATVAPNTTGAGETNTANNTAYLNGAAASTSLIFTAPTTDKANVYTTISATPQVVAAGSTVTVTVVTGNAGPTTANNVTTTVQLLPGLTILSSPSGTGYSPSLGLMSLPATSSLASGASQSYTITFTAPAFASNNGQMLLTSSVNTLTSETVAADNVASTTVTVTPTADVATTIGGPATVVAGQTATYTASYINNGQGTALGVTRTAQLPIGLTGVVVTDLATGSVVSSAYSSTSGLVTLPALTSQAAGSSSAYSISFVAPATSFAVRSTTGATTTDGVASNNSASASTTVNNIADVTVAVNGPATAVVGNAVTYYVTTTNNGPNTASGVATTLQLPANLSGVTVSSGSYTASSGLVTFAAAGTVLNGSSVADYVTFTMPSAAGGQLSATASVSSTSTDPVAGNNNMSIATSVAPNTGATADVFTTLNLPATATAGASVTATATFGNNAGTATNGIATLQLPVGTVVTAMSNSGTYNSATGVVTWPVVASATVGSANYTVTFTAPASGPVRVTSTGASQTSDSNLANNFSSATMTITAAYDAVTSISGPSSSLPGVANTYTVTATNNGPSTATSVQQRVTLPAGVTATNISGSGTQTGATITWPAISNQLAGAAGAVAYTFDVAMPASGSLALSAAVTSAGESNTGNNAAPLTTTQANRVPVARNVVNASQTPEGSTAGQLGITALAATDADGSIATYQLTGTLPAATEGTLYYNNNADGVSGTYVTLGIGQNLTANQAGTLRFDPAGSFIGNVFFTYTATDNLGAVSNAALYTIAVGQDLNSVYTTAPQKGGTLATAYQNNDLIAWVADVNTSRYDGSGQIYSTGGTNNGNLVSGAQNGIGGATTDTNGTNLLNSLGLSLDAGNGEIRVQDRTKLNLRAGSYSLNVTTVDANGGTNTQVVSFTIGFGPLPVTLVDFTAKAQNNVDALLDWKTAQEKNNDHFDVERSIDGVNFEKVGQRAGNGTSTSVHQYTFTDAGAARLAGTVYYRLQQVDTDGTTTTSEVRAVRFSKQTGVELAVFPNPAVETLNVRLNGVTGASEVTIFNAAGAVVRKGKLAGSLATSFDVQTLPTGTYLVQVKADNGQILNRRFVKN